MKRTQRTHAKLIGISEPYLSRVLSGDCRISWQLAERLSKVLPGSIEFWKNATPDRIRLALNNIQSTPALIRHSADRAKLDRTDKVDE